MTLRPRFSTGLPLSTKRSGTNWIKCRALNVLLVTFKVVVIIIRDEIFAQIYIDEQLTLSFWELYQLVSMCGFSN